MDDAAIVFSGVGKRFRRDAGHESLVGMAAAWARWALNLRRADQDEKWFWALRDVDLSVRRGEALGVIGPNGAGKSTALKLLAGILRPDAGRIDVHGRIAALIEVGAGFHGELTGRENIFLNGAILGMTRREIRGKLGAIVEFSGVGDYLDMPVKRYSSGMYARLGFSIAAHVDPDILLVDEVLSVGDAVFRLRCLDRMQELVRHGVALVFVTHNLEQMQSTCDRAVVLDRGRTAFAGGSEGAIAHYMTAMSRGLSARPTDLRSTDPGPGSVDVASVEFATGGGPVTWCLAGETLQVRIRLCCRRQFHRLILETNARTLRGQQILSFNSGRSGREFSLGPGEHAVVLELPRLPLAAGQYFWNVRAWDVEASTTELDTPFRFALAVDDRDRTTGMLALEHEWHERGTAAERPAGEVASSPLDRHAAGRETPSETVHLR